MSTITIRQCDLCDTCSSEESMFECVGGVDVCVRCQQTLKRAVEHNLIIFSPFLEEK